MAKVKARDFGDKPKPSVKVPEPTPEQVAVIRRFFKTDNVEQLMAKSGLTNSQVVKLREHFHELAESRAAETAIVDATGRATGAHAMNEAASEMDDEAINFIGHRITIEDISKAEAEGDKQKVRDLKKKLGDQIAGNRDMMMRLNSDRWIKP